MGISKGKISSHATLGLALVAILLLTPAESFAGSKGEQRQRRAAKRQVTRALSRAELRQAEARLSEMGYGTGRNALVAFQKWEGLKVTGRINRDEFDAIMSA